MNDINYNTHHVLNTVFPQITAPFDGNISKNNHPPTPYPTRRLLLLLSLLVLFCVLLWLILYISLYFLYNINISGIG